MGDCCKQATEEVSNVTGEARLAPNTRAEQEEERPAVASSQAQPRKGPQGRVE